jgi:hypothetical protein
MGTRGKEWSRSRRSLAVALGLAALVTVVGLAPAVVEAKKKRKAPASTWHIGLHPWVFSNLPSGESLLATAYCKKDAAPRKK